MLTVTESGQEYLLTLLDKKSECVGVKIGIVDGGTPLAKTALSYCKVGEVTSGWLLKVFGDLDVFIEEASIQYLEDAVVDYSQERMGGQLTIDAPNSKMPKLGEDATLHERVNYAIWNDVYPIVAQHKGWVKLVEVVDDTIAVLEFGGGCKGCSGIDVTLKDGVEKALAESVPEIKGIRDVTDHTDSSEAYMTANNGVEKYTP